MPWTFAPANIWGAGFVNVIAVDPRQNGVVLCGSDVAGIHRSVDGGETWQPSNVGFHQTWHVKIAAIHFSPTNPDVVFAAVGNGTAGGIWVSHDNGRRWAELSAVPVFAGGNTTDLAATLPSPHPRSTGNLLVLDPANYLAYAATFSGGIMRGGVDAANGTLISEFVPVDLTGQHLRSVAFRTDGTLYAASWDSGVYRVADAATAGSGDATLLSGTPACPEELLILGSWLYCVSSENSASGDKGAWRMHLDTETWEPIGNGDLDTTVDLSHWESLAGHIDIDGDHHLWAGCFKPAGDAQDRLSVMRTTNANASAASAVAWEDASTWDPHVWDNAGETWWLADEKPAMMFGGGVYVAAQLALAGSDPQNPSELFSAGRSGVWHCATPDVAASAAVWHPAVAGIATTINRDVAVDGRFGQDGNAYAANTDWVFLQSADRFLTQPDQNEPSKNTGFALAVDSRDGTVVLADGDRDEAILGKVWTNANPLAGDPWVDEGIDAAYATYVTVADTFTRASTASWGTADIASSAYSLNGGAGSTDFDVDGEKGVIYIGGTNGARTARITADDLETESGLVRVQLTEDAEGAGAAIRVGWAARGLWPGTNSYYLFAIHNLSTAGAQRHRLRCFRVVAGAFSGASSISDAGGWELCDLRLDADLGVTYQAGTWMWLRWQIVDNPSGPDLRCRVWADGDTEPDDWHLDVQDTGAALNGLDGPGSPAAFAQSLSGYTGGASAYFDDLDIAGYATGAGTVRPFGVAVGVGTGTASAAAYDGLWILREVASTSALNSAWTSMSAAAEIVYDADPDKLAGFCIRFPYDACDVVGTPSLLTDSSSIINRARTLVDDYNTNLGRDVDLSIRIMLGRHCPSRILQGTATNPTVTEDGDTIPAPWRNGYDTFNTDFEADYDDLCSALAQWCRDNSVPLLHMGWFGHNYSEVHRGQAVQAIQSGPTYDTLGASAGGDTLNGGRRLQFIDAHKRLVDIAYPYSGADLCIEFPLSGSGPISDADVNKSVIDWLADHFESKTGGGWNPRLAMQANGWGGTDQSGVQYAGDWGASPLAQETYKDRVWSRTVVRGEQDIYPASGAEDQSVRWQRMFTSLTNNQATYGELYDVPLNGMSASAEATFQAQVAAWEPYLPWGTTGAGKVIVAALEDVGDDRGGVWRKVAGGDWAQTVVPSVDGVGLDQNTKSIPIDWPAQETTAQIVALYDRARGVYRSLDGGATWTRIWAQPSNTEHTGYVAVDPTNVDRWYVSAGQRLYRLDNATTCGEDAATPVDLGVNAAGPVKVDRTGRVLVACRAAPGADPALLESTNQGAAWYDRADAAYRGGALFPFALTISDAGHVLVATNGMGVLRGEWSTETAVADPPPDAGGPTTFYGFRSRRIAHSEYRILLADALNSHRIVDELLVARATWNHALNGPGAGDVEAVAPIRYRTSGGMRYIDTIAAGRTCVYIERDGLLLFGGWVQEWESDGATVRLRIDGFEAWYRQRLIRRSLDYSGWDQLAAVRDLLTTQADFDGAIAELGGSLNLTVGSELSGVLLPAGTVFPAHERKPYADVVAELGEVSNGFDWEIRSDWSSPDSIDIVRRLLLYYPRRGTPQADVLDAGRNLTGVSVTQRRPTATRVDVLGGGEGDATLVATATAADPTAYLLAETAQNDRDLVTAEALQARANETARLAGQPAWSISATLAPGAPPMLGTFQVGDTFRCRVDWLDLDMRLRLVRWAVTIGDVGPDQIQVELATDEPAGVG